MEKAENSVGIREVKSKFSALTAEVNKTGRSLTVLKNNRPWVVINPADEQSLQVQRKRAIFERLTESIEADAEELAWDCTRSDKELLNEERVRRFG